MNIQLYGFWRSNAAFRVRVALALKQLPFEEIAVDILSGRQFDADYAAVNAEHVVPTLVYNGQRIFQSLARSGKDARRVPCPGNPCDLARLDGALSSGAGRHWRGSRLGRAGADRPVFL